MEAALSCLADRAEEEIATDVQLLNIPKHALAKWGSIETSLCPENKLPFMWASFVPVPAGVLFLNVVTPSGGLVINLNDEIETAGRDVVAVTTQSDKSIFSWSEGRDLCSGLSGVDVSHRRYSRRA